MTTKFAKASTSYEKLEAVFRSVKELLSQDFDGCEHFLTHVGIYCSSILAKASGVDDLVCIHSCVAKASASLLMGADECAWIPSNPTIAALLAMLGQQIP